MQTVRCYKLSEYDTKPVVAFYADTHEQAGIFPCLQKCVNVLTGKFTRRSHKDLVGKINKRNGKPKTFGSRDNRKIYVQYLQGEFKRQNANFGMSSPRTTGGKLNPTWSKKNPNYKKVNSECSKKRWTKILRKRTFEAMTGAIVTK